jgi:hypothetical protein
MNDPSYLAMTQCGKRAKVRKTRRYALLPYDLLKQFTDGFTVLDYKEALPMGFEIIRRAITLGNDSMPNILIGNFKKTGTFSLQPVSLEWKFDHRSIHPLHVHGQ